MAVAVDVVSADVAAEQNPVVMQAEASEPAPVAEPIAAALPVVAEAQVAPEAQPAAVVPTQVELTFEPAVEVVAAIETVVQEAEPVVSPVAAPEVVEVVEPVAVQTSPAAISKEDDLNEMLKSAGLVLAATDPNKLRDAQTSAAPVVEVRVPRVRKPRVEVSTEPLQLIQTKNNP